MKKIIVGVALLLVANIAGAGDIKLRSALNGTVQGAATDPLITSMISSNASTNVNLAGVLWFSLAYNGSSVCYVRVMNGTTKANFPQIPISSGSSFSRVVHPNANYINYSSCNATAPINSILELM